jgi:hypothetical protein
MISRLLPYLEEPYGFVACAESSLIWLELEVAYEAES